MSDSIPSDGDVLVDTNVFIEHFRTANVHLLNHLQNGKLIYVPLIVLGELFTGTYRHRQQARMLQQIHSLLSMASVLRPGEVTAAHYGQVQATLTENGTPIPQNDVWIAALAKEHKMPLVTNDGHFSKVPELTVLRW